jgi:hypothetical protein
LQVPDCLFSFHASPQRGQEPDLLGSRSGIRMARGESYPGSCACAPSLLTSDGAIWRDQLQSLAGCFNERLATLHAREYFREARFHSSFAWMPNDDTSQHQVSDLSSLLESKLGDRLRSLPALSASRVHVTTGSQKHLIDIQEQVLTTVTMTEGVKKKSMMK